MASNPWDYYDRLGDRRGAEPVDAVSAAVADVRARRAKQTIMQAPESPVDAARVTRVAREAGEPPAVVADRVGDYEKALSAQRLSDVAARYSIVADWFEKNPRSLVAAQGDVKSVGFLGRTLEFLGNIPDALQAGTTRTAKSLSELYQSIDEAILPFTNPSGGRAQLDRYESDRASYQRRYEVQRPRSDSFVVQSALSGIESIPGSATGIAVGVVSRSPGAAAAVMGLTTGAPAYREALDAGKTTGTALRYGVEQGLIEGLTEKVPAGKWLDAITKRTPAGKAILSSLAAEIPGEQLATILQDFSTWATLTPNRPFSEYLAERPQAALQTAIATITGTAAQVGATQTVVKTGDALVSRAQSARRARAEREVLTGFEKAAADSTMRANDPQGYAEMVGNMAEQSGVTGVMVDAAAVREYMQSDSYDPYSDPLEAYRDQVDEAFEVGGDVVLPSDFALGTLPGTSAWTALRDDMRLTAGGITPREAQSFEEAMADVVAEVEASQQQEFDDQQAQIDAQGKLLKSVQDKLMNAGFTPYAAQQNATLIVQRIATRAARMGQQVQGNEFTTEVRQVLPPELAAARDADATDLVINALRKGKDPTQQSGPSLLEWISARGGVNDSGGDLASMGLDQWHKGKPGKRKLVRKFDPTLALGGVSGAGDYGVDTTLRAAIEAGYFPELANVANEGGVDTLDTQVLLDAMSAELAGVKRYAADARVDAYRAAAEELDQLLMERGLDPAGMSDAELRAAIAGLGQEGGQAPTRMSLDDRLDALDYEKADLSDVDGDLKTALDVATLPVGVLGEQTGADGVRVLKGVTGVDAALAAGRPDIAQVIYERALREAADAAAARPIFDESNPKYAGALENLRKIAEQKKADAEAVRLALGDANSQSAARAFEQLPDTIEIDGVQRPTRNSEGQPIAGTEEGVRAFWAWFGDSKVVDAEGRPLVVYHGTAAEFEAFKIIKANSAIWVSPSNESADRFANGDLARTGAEPRVLSLYASIKNPFDPRNPPNELRDKIIEFLTPSWAGKTQAKRIQAGYRKDWKAGDFQFIFGIGNGFVADRVNAFMRENGIDGLIRGDSEGPGAYAAFSPTQIKSINNRGTFDPGDARILYQVTPEQARETNVPVEMPADPLFKEAVENTPGAVITEDGLAIDLVRFQKPEQEGDKSVRTGVFYLPASSADVRHYRGGKTGYGGPERFAGTTLIRRPLFVKGATGGKAPEQAFIDLLGKEQFAEMSRAVTQVITRGGNYMRPDPRLKVQLIEEFVDQYAPEMSGRGDWIERNSREGNTLRYALQEMAVAHAVREAGYDAIVGYSKGKNGAKISEVFDIREQTYPARGYESEIHDAFIAPREYYQSAYHGSPHIFDRFSLDKIGTGEGAQAYGWGLYFAGRKEIAEHYRNVLQGGPLGTKIYEVISAHEQRYGQAESKTDVIEAIRAALDKGPDAVQAALEKVAASLAKSKWDSDRPVAADVAAMAKDRALAEKLAGQASGRLYQVEIPNDDEYLLWDKPLSEQPEKVKAAIERLKGGDKPVEDLSDDELVAALGGFEGTLNGKEKTGAGFYKEMAAHYGGTVEDNGWTQVGGIGKGGDRAASLALHNAGIAGIKYLDGGSRADGDGSFNYVVFDDNRVSITAYEQSFADGPRGRIRFEQVPVIELFQGRNLSTLLHELGHQYLEELRFDSESPNAPEQLVKDMETVKAWFAANGHPVVDGFIPTEAHELWARGFERYLMEGKAPSSALARVFETFRGWLMSIYKKVDALRSPITPEIREVFDRLLATDEELQQQREAHALMPLFKDAAAIGMTGQEFQAYQEQFTEARVEAQGEVLGKAMREVKARVTREYRDQRAVVEADVTESVDQRPLFKALRNLKTMPVRKGWLEDNMGLDVFDLMPKRVPPLWSDKGSHPDAVAEMSGYQNGRQMIEALIGAEMAHRQAVEGGDRRTLRERTIQSEVDAIMRERYGDPLTDGTIEREALAAVNGEKQGEVLASELRILSRRTGQRPTPYRIARQWARNKVRQGVYATEASPSAIQRHARAVTKHGSEAEKAMLAGKFDEAFAAKQKQMLSSALLAEAKAANDEVTTAQRYLDKIARAKTMKSVDQDYLDQAQALLEDVDLRQRSQKSLDRKESFERWAAAKQAAGEEVYVPDRFDYAGTNWSRLPVEQLLGLADTVKSIMHLGRHKQTMLDNKDRREFDEWKADALAVLELTPGRAITNEVTEQRSNTRAAMALGLKVETLALELDNGVPGVWTALLSTRPTTAENERAANREKVLAPIAEAFRKMDRKDRDRLADRVTLPEVPFRSADLGDPRNGTPLSVSRMELIGMALNMGNESNFDKLARGYGVEQSVLEAVVNRELTEKDWQFVQSVWDALETLWPDIAATEREMSGVEPERVEVREVVTPFGTLRGGYYPLVYDPSQSQVGEDNLAKASDDMFGLSSGVATAKGHTKARTGFAAPLLLSPEQVIFGHVEKVITRNAYAPLVRDILKVMRDPTIRAAFDRKMGREYREMIEPWLRRQVRAGVTDERGVHWANKLLRQARINVTLVSMGLRFSTGVAQIAGISNSIGRIGVNQFRKGFARVLSNPRAAAEFVFERSPEMERRNMELNRDVAEAFNDLRNTSQGRKGIMAGARTSAAKARAFAFWHIGMIDRYVVSMPTWLGAYEQAISDGKSDEEASALADSAVRQSQGSGREKDMAAIQSPDSEALKFFTMFYTPFNVLLNAQWETARGARRGDWRKVAQLTFWFMIAAPLVDALLSGDAPDDDDDETWAAWLARNVLTYQVAGIPIIRDIGNYAERKIRGEYVTFGSNPVTRIFDTTARTGKDAWNATLGEGEVSDRWVRNAVETPGYFLGLPTGQVSATSQFMWDYSNGDVDPETMGEWYEGLTKGKIEEEE